MRRATILGLWLIALGGCGPAPPEIDRAAQLSVGAAMSQGAESGFARATTPREFSFPADHGPHEAFRTEWWYFTGNLSSDAVDGEADEFGFQLTVFRHALTPAMPQRESRWAGRDVWFGHFALGDAAAGKFHAFERFERGAVGLAGARAEPFAAWIGDWRIESVAPERSFPMRLVAAEGEVALELVVDLEKPIVLQGDRGLSQKGPEPGNASYYYSAPRLDARGTVTVGDATRRVGGSAWLDREWSTSALSEGQVGWDWFSIQLDDGRELMLYRLRREDGTTDPFNSGTLIEVDGSVRRFGPDDVRYEPGRVWRSERGAEYPVEWRLTVESIGLELETTPMLDASELPLFIRYWEGAIRVRGRDGGGEVGGRGFLEMTGYDPLNGEG